ncbi:hypothetical protein N9K75_01960, partial [bacterium]|nr:hypothetical protein [bacterium]
MDGASMIELKDNGAFSISSIFNPPRKNGTKLNNHSHLTIPYSLYVSTLSEKDNEEHDNNDHDEEDDHDEENEEDEDDEDERAIVKVID